MKKIIIIMIVSIICMGYASAETLTVNVENVDVNKGPVLVGLYGSKESFPNENGSFRNAKAESTAKTVTLSFPDLPKGTYVVAIFQDKNNNGVMDKILGIPSEKYGFSGNTMMPDWDKNSFEFNADMAVTVKLR